MFVCEPSTRLRDFVTGERFRVVGDSLQILRVWPCPSLDSRDSPNPNIPSILMNSELAEIGVKGGY